MTLARGEFVARFVLAAFDNQRGPDLELALTYRSIGDGRGNATLAWGWYANFFQNLTPLGNGNWIWNDGDGRNVTFMGSGGAFFVQTAGRYMVMRNVTGGYEIEDRDGTRRVFKGGNAYQLTYLFDAAGNRFEFIYDTTHKNLTRIIDPHDRAIDLRYNNTAALLQSPFHQGSPVTPLSNITDFAQRTYRIRHDAATGRIAALLTPTGTGTGFHQTNFTYLTGHLLHEIRDHAGHKHLETHYTSGRRVAVQRMLNGTQIHEWRFEYLLDLGHTYVTDPNGNEAFWNFRHEVRNGGVPTGIVVVRTVPSDRIEYTRDLRQGDPRW